MIAMEDWRNFNYLLSEAGLTLLTFQNRARGGGKNHSAILLS
jgi:hypothetical protein